MITEEAYAYMLHNVPGLGKKSLLRLFEEFGSCEEIYKSNTKFFEKILTQKQINSLESVRRKWDINGEFDHLYRMGIDFYLCTSDKYPTRLKDVPDYPFALYCKGNMPDEKRPSVSIIGARNSSEYGKYVARMFGERLAMAGVQIVSGMARGIDGIAQQSAMSVGGDSYGVLGSGVDVCYPEENRGLYEALLSKGGIISEYIPGTMPRPQLFPPRNRIISGLSDAVIVVEARQKSGTLITVDMALEQGREVFAVPGRICDNLSSGCNSLIKQGAEIATAPEDIVEYLRKNLYQTKLLNSDENTVDDETNATDSVGEMMMNEKQREIYRLLDFYPQTTASIFERTAGNSATMSISEVMNTLVELCIMGMVSQNGAGFYKKG